jgi:hypothetical protein
MTSAVDFYTRIDSFRMKQYIRQQATFSAIYKPVSATTEPRHQQ